MLNIEPLNTIQNKLYTAKLQYAGIGGPTNKINYTHYSLLTTNVFLVSHFSLCLSFLDRDVARSTFLHLHFHRIPEPFF